MELVFEYSGWRFTWPLDKGVTVKIGSAEGAGWTHQMDPPNRLTVRTFFEVIEDFHAGCVGWVNDYEAGR